MHRYMRHLDDLAGLDIVIARKQVAVSSQAPLLSRLSAGFQIIWARVIRRHTSG